MIARHVGIGKWFRAFFAHIRIIAASMGRRANDRGARLTIACLRPRPANSRLMARGKD